MTDINDWISVSQISGGSGTNQVTITVDEYYGTEDRTQSLKIVSADGMKEVFVTIQQKAFKPSFTTNKQIVSFTQEVLSQGLEITSNFNWEARTDSNWFTLSQTEGNKGTTTIEISTSSIDSPSENRNGTINFYLGDTFVTAITVKQEFEVIFEVSTTSIDMTDETTATINVTSNVDWYCNTDITWINLDIVQGFGDKTITVTAQTFNGQDRNGTIDFYVGGEIINRVEIYQINIIPDQFYIEPHNEGESVTFQLDSTLSYTPDSDLDSIDYYDEEEGRWITLKAEIGDPSRYYQLTITKRTYFKNHIRNHIKNISSTDTSIISLRNGFANIGGNIETLLGKMKEYYAYRLFSGSGVVDASNLILPSKNLSPYCYYRMFWGCTNLVNAPQLPATTLAEYCYEDMFNECTNLVNAPQLPATTLAASCYDDMFSGCKNLVNAPQLPATTLATNCYAHMFSGCENLVNAPQLPATTLAFGCYQSMFSYCTSLVNAPQLPATTLLQACYIYMFLGCNNLNNITMLGTERIGTISLGDWVSNVSSTGTFTKKQGVDIPSGTSGIPKGWTVVEVP